MMSSTFSVFLRMFCRTIGCNYKGRTNLPSQISYQFKPIAYVSVPQKIFQESLGCLDVCEKMDV